MTAGTEGGGAGAAAGIVTTSGLDAGVAAGCNVDSYRSDEIFRSIHAIKACKPSARSPYMNMANSIDTSKTDPCSPSTEGKIPRNGCMIRLAAR